MYSYSVASHPNLRIAMSVHQTKKIQNYACFHVAINIAITPCELRHYNHLSFDSENTLQKSSLNELPWGTMT